MIRIHVLIILTILTLSNQRIVPENKGSSETVQEPFLRFGIITDVQYCNCEPDNTRHYAESLSKLKNSITDLNSMDLSFLVNLGDLIDRDFSSFDSVLPIISESKAPVYHVLGNHDFSVNSREKEDIYLILNTPSGYYSFSFEGIRFLVLNSTDISLFSPRSKSRIKAEKLLERLTLEGKSNTFDWNGTIGDEQTKWLVSQLDLALEHDERVIIFSHHPVWPESQYCMLEYEKIIGITERYNNIGAWFSGHRHEGSYGNLNLVHYVTFRGMVETEDMNSYAVVELYHNKIWIKGFGREKSQILAW